MQINTKLPLSVVFDDFKSSEQDLLVRPLIGGAHQMAPQVLCPMQDLFLNLPWASIPAL